MIAFSCFAIDACDVASRGLSRLRASRIAACTSLRRRAAADKPAVSSSTDFSAGPGTSSTTAGPGSTVTDAVTGASGCGGGVGNPRRAAARRASASACASLHASQRPPSAPARQYLYAASVPCLTSSSRLRGLPGGIATTARPALALRLPLQPAKLAPLLLRHRRTLTAQLFRQCATPRIPRHNSSVRRSPAMFTQATHQTRSAATCSQTTRCCCDNA